MAGNTFITTSDCERVLLDTSILIFTLNPKRYGEPKDTILKILSSMSANNPKSGRKRTFLISSVTVMELSWLAQSPAMLLPSLSSIIGASNVELVPFDETAAFWLNNNLSSLAKKEDKLSFAKAVQLNDLSKKQSLEYITRDMMIVASAANHHVDLVLSNDEDVRQICDQVKMFCVKVDPQYWHIVGNNVEFNPNTIPNLPTAPPKR